MVEAEVTGNGRIDWVQVCIETENCVVLLVEFVESGMIFVGEMGDDSRALPEHTVVFGDGVSILVKNLPFQVAVCACEARAGYGIITFLRADAIEQARTIWERGEGE